MKQFNRKWTLDRQKFLSETEVRKLRRVVEDKALADLQKGRTTWPRFWMAIDLAMNAGLRVSEIVGLKVDNLYLNSREPRMRATYRQRKVKRPSYDKLKHDVELLGYVGTGKKYGVSDNSIRKWLKFYKNQPQNLN